MQITRVENCSVDRTFLCPHNCTNAVGNLGFLRSLQVLSAVVGTKAVLRCPNTSVSSLILVIWKIRPKSESHCSLAYRADANKTDRTNCNERMTWQSSPDHDPALQIHPVRLADEGNYICEIATSDGTFCLVSALTVLVPPVVTLTHGSNGVVVCQASAGKPAAEISWAQGNGHSTENKTHHTNGTVTTLSSMPMINSTNAHVTCLVTHPAMNQTQTIELSSSEVPGEATGQSTVSKQG
uniref:Ig-like domain-containing protein n=1 Tax=Terrapene triunguis TaxID=2587831 RepID=A0A674ICU6_9SAUR